MSTFAEFNAVYAEYSRGAPGAKHDRRQAMLGLIRRYLNAGIMANGLVMERHEGTPQGGPLSPLLA